MDFAELAEPVWNEDVLLQAEYHTHAIRYDPLSNDARNHNGWAKQMTNGNWENNIICVIGLSHCLIFAP